MSENPEKRAHPLVEKILTYFHEMNNCLELDDYALEQIEDEFRKYFDKPELIEAVVALLDLANVLNEQGSKKSAIRIIQITVMANPALEELNKKRAFSNCK